MSQVQNFWFERYGRYREVYHCSNDCAHSFGTKILASSFSSLEAEAIRRETLSTIAVQPAATFRPLKNYICEVIVRVEENEFVNLYQD